MNFKFFGLAERFWIYSQDQNTIQKDRNSHFISI